METLRVDLEISQNNRKHFHQYFDGGNFIANGSLIGYSPYALSIGAKYEPPKQTFFLIKDGYGKTVTAPIFL